MVRAAFILFHRLYIGKKEGKRGYEEGERFEGNERDFINDYK